MVTAPPRIALLCRDAPMRINSRPNRVAERRVNAEIALVARLSSLANMASIAPRIRDLTCHGAAGKAHSRIRRASGC